MSRDTALRCALNLYRIPTQVRPLRAAPLPENMMLLLRVAAGDADAAAEATAMTDTDIETLKSASGFFIEQILLCPAADSYRILGADRTASLKELRGHMALLMKWLHPDLDHNDQRALFATRVTRAWENLKSDERRMAYDATLAAAAPMRPTKKLRYVASGPRPSLFRLIVRYFQTKRKPHY